MNTTYTPVNWAIVEITSPNNKKSKQLLYDLEHSNRHLNGGNSDEKEFEDRWEFTAYNGRVFICYKQNYGVIDRLKIAFDNLKSMLEAVNGNIEVLNNYV